MKDVYTIGEIGKLFRVGADSLRYYERLGILSPRRGENGYRLYGPDDIWRLNIIRDLRELGMSVESIGSYIQNRSLSSTVQLLTDEIRMVREQQKHLSLLRQNLSERLKILLQAENLPAGRITEKHLEERRYWAIPESYRCDDEMNLLMQRLVRRGEDGRLIGNNRIGSFFELRREKPAPEGGENKLEGREDVLESREDVLEGGIGEEAAPGGRARYTGAFLIRDDGPQTIPEGTYLSLVYRGDYFQSPIWAEKMAACARKQGLTAVPPFLELLWADIHETAETEEFVTELQVLVRRPADFS